MANSNQKYRVEKDSMGPVKVPKGVYYGAQTQRAAENFPVSGWRFQREMIFALGLIKFASAKTNFNLGLMEKRMSGAIQKASEEVMQGRWDNQFIVDIFQTGSGTSTNMNANEVIANRANETLGSPKGIYKPVHPNDHVNLCQSSNDVFPSGIHIAAVNLLQNKLIPGLKALYQALTRKEKGFHSILKIGRTHLQDALPIRLGQEFGGYARQVQLSIRRIQKAMESLYELPLGGTAVGTGMNAHPLFAKKAISIINEKTEGRFREAVDHFEAQGAKERALGSALLTGAIHKKVGLFKCGLGIAECGIYIINKKLAMRLDSIAQSA